MRAGRRSAGLGVLVGMVAAALLAPPAGATLAYTTSWWSEHSTIWVARNDGSAARELFASSMPIVVGSPSHVSPDGRRVAYQTNELAAHGVSRLVIAPTTGGPAVTVATEVLFLAWSPDSRLIVAFAYLPDGRQRLLTIDAATGQTTTVIETEDIDGASFSPDSSKLVYSAGRGLGATLYTIPVTGGTPTAITDGHRSQWPVWGKRWIAFTRWQPTARRPKLYLVKPAGTSLRQITHTFIPRIEAKAWSADGRHLLVEITKPTVPYAATVDVRDGIVHPIGKPSRANGGHGVVPRAISRDGKTVLGTRGSARRGDTDVVTLPFRGGRMHVLVRHAIDPSWSR